MEYRDLSRIVASDGDDGQEAPARIRRFEFVRSTGRLDLRKIAAVLLLAVSLVAVLGYVGGQVARSTIAWLHRQPQYQLPFDQIELPVPPPACFRGGAYAFLERVRRNADEAEILPVLDVNPERIDRAFKLFPWVEAVESIEFPPRGLIVRLAYREPVAHVLVATSDQVVLDRHGLILPLEDIDTERLGRLILIRGEGLTVPSTDRLGKLWKTETPQTPRRAAVDEAVLQAARLSGFLLEPSRKEQAESTSALRILAVIISDPRGLFLQNSENAMILWGRGPGDEQPGELSAQEKWGILANQAAKGLLKPGQNGDYWEFGRNELRFKRYNAGS